MMNCKEATRLLSDAMDRELSFKDRLALRFHVMMCAGCRNFARHMSALRELARAFAGRPGD